MRNDDLYGEPKHKFRIHLIESMQTPGWAVNRPQWLLKVMVFSIPVALFVASIVMWF